MSKITRRQLLIFFGSSAATTVLAPALTQKLFGINSTSAEAVVPTSFTPVRLPHPLPIYRELPSFMPTAPGGQGTVMAASQDTRLTSYSVVDDVVVPPEYERYVIVRWGDRVFPDPADYFGYNNDYTGFVALGGSNDDGYLWVNHEYVSFPMSKVAPEAPSDVASFPTTDRAVLGIDLSVKNQATLGEFLYNLGGSIVRITKQANGRFQAIAGDPLNRRIHGLSGLGINSQRTDKYKDVTSWGTRQGDNNYLTGTAPQPPKSSRKSTATDSATGSSVQPTTVPAAQPLGAQSSPPKKISKVANYSSSEFRKTSNPTAAKPATPRALPVRNSA